MTTRFVEPIMQALDDTGTAVQGSRLLFYEQGTTTFLDTYQESGEVLPNTNPVESVAGGRFPNIFLQEANYTVRFTIPINGVDTDVWTVDITGISVPFASESVFGITRYATPSEMQAGVVTDRTATVQRITQDIVLDASRIQSGTFNSARLPAATTTTQGATILADETDITNGTAGKVVDASQLQAAINSITQGGIIIRLQNNINTSGAVPGNQNEAFYQTIGGINRPDGGFLSDLANSEQNESYPEFVKWATIEYSLDGGDTFVTAEDA